MIVMGGGIIQPHRRLQAKSHGGCAQCKRRKIKCDEMSPSCNRCIKHRILCSFNPVKTPAASSDPSMLSTPLVAESMSPSHLLDLELLYNFTTATHHSLGTCSSTRKIHQSEFVAGFKYKYLIHSVLVVSAFHLISQQQQGPQNPSGQQTSPAVKLKTYLSAAVAHYHLAVRSFRHNLTDISPENCHSLLACSCLVFIASLSRPRDNNTTEDTLSFSINTQRSGRILEWLNLLRGLRTIINLSRDWIRTGPFAVLLDLDCQADYNAGTLEKDIALQLDGLSAVLSDNFADNVSDICEVAVKLLRKSYADLSVTNDTLVVFQWPALVPDKYLKMLEAQRPEALLVFAYYCALLYKMDCIWWIHGWPAYMVQIIKDNLDSKWRPSMQWPLHLMGIGTE